MFKQITLAVGLASIVVSGIAAKELQKGFNVGSIQVDNTVNIDAHKRDEGTVKLHNNTIAIPSPSVGYGDTIIYSKSSKKSYGVNEPITIQLKLKRDAYIYFWTIGSSGKGYLVLPNNFESFNRYKKNTHYVVPERSAKYQFISDRVGTEKVYVLATDKIIDHKKIASIFSGRVGGLVPVATKKNIERFITKDLRVVAKKQTLKFVIKSFQIPIINK